MTRRHWNKMQLAFIGTNYTKMGAKTLAEILDTTEANVYHLISKLRHKGANIPTRSNVTQKAAVRKSDPFRDAVDMLKAGSA